MVIYLHGRMFYYTGLQNKIVTSSKVGELNSTFYAELKYIPSFSLSRKVFK
jgi:hypothetical protein